MLYNVFSTLGASRLLSKYAKDSAEVKNRFEHLKTITHTVFR